MYPILRLCLLFAASASWCDTTTRMSNTATLFSDEQNGFVQHLLGEWGSGVEVRAKRLEEVWVPGSSDPLILPRSSEGLYLLQRIRDEAHRFAITFHRSRRSKVMLESILDEIPQLGQARRKALLERFGSVAAIRKATVEDIAATPGIGSKIAAVIGEQLAAMSSQRVNTTTGEIVESM